MLKLSDKEVGMKGLKHLRVQQDRWATVGDGIFSGEYKGESLEDRFSFLCGKKSREPGEKAVRDRKAVNCSDCLNELIKQDENRARKALEKLEAAKEALKYQDFCISIEIKGVWAIPVRAKTREEAERFAIEKAQRQAEAVSARSSSRVGVVGVLDAN